MFKKVSAVPYIEQMAIRKHTISTQPCIPLPLIARAMDHGPPDSVGRSRPFVRTIDVCRYPNSNPNTRKREGLLRYTYISILVIGPTVNIQKDDLFHRNSFQYLG